MVFDLKSPKFRRILLILAVSAFAYAISSVIAYVVAVNMPISIAIASTRVGFFVAAVVFLLLSRDKVDIGFSNSGRVSWIYGVSFAVVGVLLFLAYKSSTLASIFPLLEGGVLVFLALDLIRHRKRLTKKEIGFLVLGVGIVFLGTFFAESHGFTFNISILPYAVGMMVASGIGYYAMVNNTKKVTESSKYLAFVISGFVSAAVLLALYHEPAVLAGYSNVYFFLGAVAGALLCVAFSMEIRAVKYGLTGNIGKDVIFRNFVNNFTELDTVIVLLASVAIGSFTFEALFGGAMIVLGVLVISAIK